MRKEGPEKKKATELQYQHFEGRIMLPVQFADQA